MNATETRTERPQPHPRAWIWIVKELIDKFADAEAHTLAEVERGHIFRTLRETEGSITLAARSLGIDRKTLYVRLRRYSLEAVE
jgi:transcriptional regulator of acetoin/glycerol metabolism